MYNIIADILKSGDQEKICSLAEIIEEILSRTDIDYSHQLHLLQYGPHFTEDLLEESGVPMKYSVAEVTRLVGTQGISFPDCTTIPDITYTVNSLYQTYYPLISDLPQALKFAEKYIKDSQWPENAGRPFIEWWEKKNL